MRSAELRAAAARIGALRAGLLVVFFVLAARAAHLTVVEVRWENRGDRQIQTVFALPPARGMILDRRGIELALTIASPSVYSIPSALDNSARQRLARALGEPRGRIEARLGQRERFTWVKRWVSAAQADKVRALGLPDVGILQEPRRAYPAGALGGRVLGFADIDGKGVRGIEQQEHEWLAGTRRVVPVQRDGAGHLIVDTPWDARASQGGDVALTLDATLQAEAEAALLRTVAETGARGGIVVTLEPRSGELLAVAEAPAFDPNHFRRAEYADTGSAAFLDADDPGSTLKVFLAAAALDAGSVGERDAIDCSGGEVEVPGKTIRDRRDFGTLDLGGVLRVSSNVGAVHVAQALGARAHYEALVRFGFGRSTGSGFPSESAGLVRPWRKWKPVDHATIAFGQGIGVTAVQLAAATGALANEGVWLPPRLVAARRSASGSWVPAPRAKGRRAVGAATARRVLEMMEGVVGAEGTGRLAALRGLRVAGKTGTAQKLDRAANRYHSDRFVAWFIGVVPADDPQLAIVVAVDEPRGAVHSGGGVAAPLFARVAAAQLARLGIATEPEPIPAAQPQVLMAELSTAPPAAPPTRPAAKPARPRPPAVSAAPPRPRVEIAIARLGDSLLVPDFRGHSLSDVRRITAEHAIALEASGRGRAVAQQPRPGSIVEGGTVMRVRFGGTGEG